MVVAYGSYVGGRLLVLVSTAILAHLLRPSEFGVVALALLASTLLDRVADFGVAEALVIAPDEELEQRSQTAFRLTMITGGAVAVLIAALSGVFASFFDQDQLQELLLLVALNLFIRTTAQTPYALAQRSLNFSVRAVAELSDVLVRGIVSIILAVAGVGAMSLMLGYLAGSISYAVILWWRTHFRPRRGRTGLGARSMLGFGGKLTILEIFSTIQYNIDNAVVGKVLGAASLGYYQMAYRMPELLVYNLSVVAGRVLYPAFAAVDEGTQLVRAYLVSMRYLLVVSIPASTGLVLLARPFIVAVFGHRWLPAVPAMQVIVALSMSGVIGIPAGTVYKATNRVGVLLWLNVPRFIIIGVGLVLFADDGIVAVALVMTTAAVSGALIGIAFASHLLHVRAREIFRAAWPAVVSGVPAAGVFAVAADVFENSPWVALSIGGIAGSLVYVATMMVVAPGVLGYAIDRVRGRSG